MTTISATIVVYNEEARIESVLRSLRWCDEIVVVDKSSTDRTREIAARYTDRIVVVPYSDFAVSELRAMVGECRSEWVLWCTASRLVPRAAAEQIRKIISDPDLPYDVIEVPFARYVLGISEPYSPWWTPHEALLFRRSVARLREDNVHASLRFTSTRRMRMPAGAREENVLHLTHASVDSMMERHVRYCRMEPIVGGERLTVRRAAMSVWRSIYEVTVKRRTVFHGADGLALAFAWVSYWMLRYLYVWEKKRSHASETYERIERTVAADWEREP